ncbi:hypothetical protein ACFE04_004843 [Oxalis oulophora]
MSLSPPLLNLHSSKISSPLLFFTPIHIHKVYSPKNLKFASKLHSISSEFALEQMQVVVGDCVVFEDDVFEDPYLVQNDYENRPSFDNNSESKKQKQKRKNDGEIEGESLVPDKWREVQAEINITKQDRRKIKHEMQANSRLEKRKPVRAVNLEQFKTYREAKLAQLDKIVLDNPSSFPVKEDVKRFEEMDEDLIERAAPKNPRWAVYGKGLDDVTEFFNSDNYEPGGKKTEGPQKLFTKEEKFLLNRRIPRLAPATSDKWKPVHTLAASGEFYLLDALLKHHVDINTVDKDGMTALHRAVTGRKQAITNYLLRESADPFVQDEDGASLMHYAVRTASMPTIKQLLLYNVDINLPDNNGWTPLHLAVQARRTDVVRLLLIKGADKTLTNQDGLTPLDLCLTNLLLWRFSAERHDRSSKGSLREDGDIVLLQLLGCYTLDYSQPTGC